MPDENKKTRLQKMVNRLRNRLFNQKRRNERSPLEQLERAVPQYLSSTRRYNRWLTRISPRTVERDYLELQKLKGRIVHVTRNPVKNNGFNSNSYYDRLDSLNSRLDSRIKDIQRHNDRANGVNPNSLKNRNLNSSSESESLTEKYSSKSINTKDLHKFSKSTVSLKKERRESTKKKEKKRNKNRLL